MSNKTGGPAFPTPYVLPENQGLTIRDYFAAKAMQGILTGLVNTGEVPLYGELAELTYKTADAMLAEREKNNE